MVSYPDVGPSIGVNFREWIRSVHFTSGPYLYAAKNAADSIGLLQSVGYYYNGNSWGNIPRVPYPILYAVVSDRGSYRPSHTQLEKSGFKRCVWFTNPIHQNEQILCLWVRYDPLKPGVQSGTVDPRFLIDNTGCADILGPTSSDSDGMYYHGAPSTPRGLYMKWLPSHPKKLTPYKHREFCEFFPIVSHKDMTLWGCGPNIKKVENYHASHEVQASRAS